MAIVSVPDKLFSSLSISLMRVSELVKDGTSCSVYGFKDGKLQVSTGVMNVSKDVLLRIHHTCSTDFGFSGGPMIHDCKLVAMHHSRDIIKKVNMGTIFNSKFVSGKLGESGDYETGDETYKLVEKLERRNTDQRYKVKLEHGTQYWRMDPKSGHFVIEDYDQYFDPQDVYEDLRSGGFMMEGNFLGNAAKAASGFSQASSESSNMSVRCETPLQDCKTSQLTVSKKQKKDKQGEKEQLKQGKAYTALADALTALTPEETKNLISLLQRQNSGKVLHSGLGLHEMPPPSVQVYSGSQETVMDTQQLLVIHFSRKQDKLFNKITHHRVFRQALTQVQTLGLPRQSLMRFVIEFVLSQHDASNPLHVQDFLSTSLPLIMATFSAQSSNGSSSQL